MNFFKISRSFLTTTLVAAALSVSAIGASQAEMPVTEIRAPKTGVKAWLVTETATPIISISMIFKGGANLEPDNKRGMTRLMSYLLDEGAGDLDALAFQQKLEDYAIQISSSAQRDYFRISMETLSEHQDIAFDLLHKALTAPHFKEDAIDRMRTHMLVSLKRAKSSPHSLLDDGWRDQVFANHVYQHKLRGNAKDLNNITTQDLKEYHRLLLTQKSVAIGITGDIDAKQAEKRLDDLFMDVPAKRETQSNIAFQKPILTPVQTILDHDFPQSNALFTQLGPNRKDPDFFPAYLVNHILGGSGFTSRLTQEVREKKGLAYSVSSYLNPMQFSATWQGAVATQADRMPQSIEIIRKVWADMRENGPTSAELADAKTYLIGSYALGFTSNDAIASRLAAYQYQNLPLSDFHNRNKFIEDVTLEDAQKIARKWLTPENLSFIIVGQDWQK